MFLGSERAARVGSIPIARSTSRYRWQMPANSIASLQPPGRWLALAVVSHAVLCHFSDVTKRTLLFPFCQREVIARRELPAGLGPVP